MCAFHVAYGSPEYTSSSVCGLPTIHNNTLLLLWWWWLWWWSRTWLEVGYLQIPFFQFIQMLIDDLFLLRLCCSLVQVDVQLGLEREQVRQTAAGRHRLPTSRRVKLLCGFNSVLSQQQKFKIKYCAEP